MSTGAVVGGYNVGSSSTQVFFAQTSGGISQYRVGATDNPPDTFDGIIDEFHIYAVRLSAADIQATMRVAYCGP